MKIGPVTSLNCSPFARQLIFSKFWHQDSRNARCIVKIIKTSKEFLYIVRLITRLARKEDANYKRQNKISVR